MGRGSGGLADPGSGLKHERVMSLMLEVVFTALFGVVFDVIDSRSFIRMQISAAGDFGGGGGVYRARVSKRVDGSRGGLPEGRNRSRLCAPRI